MCTRSPSVPENDPGVADDFNPMGFDSEYRDLSTTGLINLRARMYDPGTGSFLTTDPVGSYPDYSFAAGNPAMFGLPSGQGGIALMANTLRLFSAVAELSAVAIASVFKVDELASEYGRLLRLGSRVQRSAAASKLVKFGGSAFDDLLDNPLARRLLRVGGKATSVVGFALEFASHWMEGDSVAEAGVKAVAAGSTVARFAALGTSIGCAVAPGPGCVVGAVVGGIIGILAADTVTNVIEREWPW